MSPEYRTQPPHSEENQAEEGQASMEIKREGHRGLEGLGRDGEVNHQRSQPIAEEERPCLAGEQAPFSRPG